MKNFYDLFFLDGYLSEKYFWYSKSRNLRFTSDELLYNMFVPNNVYFEEYGRFAPNNSMEELNSTIHQDHTPEHIEFSINLWKKYLHHSEHERSKRLRA